MRSVGVNSAGAGRPLASRRRLTCRVRSGEAEVGMPRETSGSSAGMGQHLSGMGCCHLRVMLRTRFVSAGEIVVETEWGVNGKLKSRNS